MMSINEVAKVDESTWEILRLAGTMEDKRKHIFLRLLAETCNIKLAAEAAGYKTTAVINRLRKTDAAFEEAFQEAVEAAADMLEAEAVRRGKQGVIKKVWFKGEPVGEEIVYSDSLLAMLLKAAKPDKYAERSKQTVDVNAKVGIAVIPIAVKSLEDWERQSLAVHAEQDARDPPKPKADVIDAEFTEVKRG